MRFVLFRKWLLDMIAATRPQLVAFEQAHMRGGPATDLLVGMTTRVVEICAEMNIDHQPVHSMTLKKAATGSGKSDKDAMIKAAKKKFPGIEILSDDQADALCLLDYAIKEYCTL
jgi:Holliday junction resolvasome RuvABC endonuclease subunit